MYTPPFTISAEAINKIADISRLIERYAIRMEQEDALMLRKANKIKIIHSSLAIEGNTLDEEQVRDIVNGKTVVAPIRQIQEVENMVYANQHQYYDAITASSNAADSGPFIDFMLGEIQKNLEAHKREPIKKVPNKIPNKVPNKLLQAFPEMQSMAWSVYLQIAANGHLTTIQMAEALGISDRMVRKYINTLKAKGLITRVGSNKTGHWEANKI